MAPLTPQIQCGTNARTCHFCRLFDRLPVRILASDLHHRILRKKSFQFELIMRNRPVNFVTASFTTSHSRSSAYDFGGRVKVKYASSKQSPDYLAICKPFRSLPFPLTRSIFCLRIFFCYSDIHVTCTSCPARRCSVFTLVPTHRSETSFLYLWQSTDFFASCIYFLTLISSFNIHIHVHMIRYTLPSFP